MEICDEQTTVKLTDDIDGPMKLQTDQVTVTLSLSSVHPLYVVEIVVLQLLPLELEGVCDQTGFRGPWFRTQVDLQWNLKPL